MMSTYRRQFARCTICKDASVFSECVRCVEPLCLSHTPTADQRCQRCEIHWTEPLRGMWVLGRWPMAGLLVALVTSMFITGSAASVNYWSPEIEQVKWVGGGVSLALMLALAASQLIPSLRMEHARRRFMKERLH